MRYYVAMMHWDISVVQKSKKIFLIHESYSLTFSRSVFISSICRFKSPTSASESSFSMLIFLSCRCRLLVRHSSSRSTSIASFSLSCCASVIFESSWGRKRSKGYEGSSLRKSSRQKLVLNLVPCSLSSPLPFPHGSPSFRVLSVSRVNWPQLLI